MKLSNIFPYLATVADRAAKMYPNDMQKQRVMIEDAKIHCIGCLPDMDQSTGDEWVAEIHKFATPKSEGCSKVLQLMDDEDLGYEEALGSVIEQYKQNLEIELNLYI